MAIDISVIITALNEEGNIRDTVTGCLDAFGRFGLSGEVIVVNDGSTDGTEEIVTELKRSDPRIKIIRHLQPKGVGASFWDGVDCAQGEIVAWFPADNENDPAEIFVYYPLLRQVDIVVPYIFNPEVRPRLRHFFSRLYRFLVNATFFTTLNYTNGTNLYRRSVLQALKYRCTGFFFQTDIIIRATKIGYLYAEVPCRLRRRKQGVSKAISWRSLSNVIRGYLRLAIDYHLLKNMRIQSKFALGSQTSRRRLADK